MACRHDNCHGRQMLFSTFTFVSQSFLHIIFFQLTLLACCLAEGTAEGQLEQVSHSSSHTQRAAVVMTGLCTCEGHVYASEPSHHPCDHVLLVHIAAAVSGSCFCAGV